MLAAGLTTRMFLTDGPADAAHVFVFAHGAGGAMDGAFMNDVAKGLAARGIHVVRFEFPYMAARRQGKKSGAPDRQPVLLDSWRQTFADVRAKHPRAAIAIGGKSMGGRMASMVADELRASALICLGYPFHPPGKPQQLRTEHLAALRTPTLILQGERDPFGTAAEVATYKLSPAISVDWVKDGDHSFKPRAASGVTLAANVEQAVERAAVFIFGHNEITR
ncbi:MAG TPA: alpha/beta family hydrolase [Thermoanaerobaculia bacterium]|nr:alpha/beta family hydrolase [Thermoanaerobaculia bacterium]